MIINCIDESNLDFVFDGVDLMFILVVVDDKVYDDYIFEDEKLIIYNLLENFILKIENYIDL